jgi:hypothetical protein
LSFEPFFLSQKRVQAPKKCSYKKYWGVAPNPNRFLKKAVQKLLWAATPQGRVLISPEKR